jgi:hypothetical protein
VPILRLLFVTLEAVFTFLFRAVNIKTDFGYGMVHICQWARNTLEYDGLCSHNPLNETPSGDHGITAEELEAQAAESLQKRTDYFRDWREKTKNANPAEYYAKANQQESICREKPWRSEESDKRSKAKVVEKKKYCATFEHTFSAKNKLTKHLTGPKHAAKAALYQQSSS